MSRASNDYNKGFVAGSRAQLQAFRARFGSAKQPEVPLPDVQTLNTRQRRVLSFVVIIALIAGVLLIGKFFTVIALSFLAAVLFYPLYQWIQTKGLKSGTAGTMTYLATLLAVIIPVGLTIFISYGEIKHLIDQLNAASATFSLSDASTVVLDKVNGLLDTLTHGTVQITTAELQDAISKLSSALATFFLNLITASFTGIANLVTQFILYTYLFTAVLTHAEKLKSMFRKLNPLGEDVSDMYLARTGQMTRGVVGGQFIIAICQGFTEAFVLWIAGVPYFFFFAWVLTFLSIIPLGGGILAIPIGIIMMLTGNVTGGIFVLLMHFFVIVNIDNILRPRLIPKSIRLNPALMLLSVFGGLELFGFLGIAIGPIIMILIQSTIQMYLPVVDARRAEDEREGNAHANV
jgi:predicted PurR-regulated permease PerM